MLNAVLRSNRVEHIFVLNQMVCRLRNKLADFNLRIQKIQKIRKIVKVALNEFV